MRRVWDDFEDCCEWDEDLEEFNKQWEDAAESLPADHPTRNLLAQRLVRFAFTDDRDILGKGEKQSCGWWYSSCRETWVEEQNCSHCWVCKECVNWREWHCKVCRKCRYGVSLACEGCGGVSSMYHSMIKMEMGQGMREGS